MSAIGISLSEAAIRLGLNKRELRGVVKGMGIRLERIGSALVMTPATYEQIERHLADLAEAPAESASA